MRQEDCSHCESADSQSQHLQVLFFFFFSSFKQFLGFTSFICIENIKVSLLLVMWHCNILNEDYFDANKYHIT